MASDAAFDVEQLCQPISEEIPVGNDVGEDFESDFQELRAAQREARSVERPTVDGIADASNEWREVSRLAEKILTEESKDIRVAVWMLEAHVRLSQFAGLRDGLSLIHELVSRYGEDLFPRPEEEEHRITVWPIDSLDGEEDDGPLPRAIRNIPLTSAPDAEYALWQYEQGEQVAALEPQQKQSRINEGAVSFEMFKNAVAGTSDDRLRLLVSDIDSCVTKLDELDDLFEQKCGESSNGVPLTPSTSRTRKMLGACSEMIELLAGDRLKEPEDEPADDEQGSGGDTSAATGRISGPVGSREEAFRQLKEVASFFRQTEPHSPISYAIEQVVRWGELPLPELLSELVEDSSARDALFKWVGITAPESNDEY